MNNTGQVTLNQRLDLGAGGNIAFGADGTLVVNSGITGDVDFNDGAGTLVMASNFGTSSKFSNAANATVQIFSSLISLRDSSAGNIGNIIIGNDNSSATLYANSGISFTGNMIFGSQGGKLWVHNDQVSFSGKIINGIKAELYLENNFTALEPSIGSVNTVNIVDNKTYTIDAKNGNVDLLNNGAKIIFEGADSEVDLVNTGNANKQFTLYSNLNPSNAEDEYGIVRVEATTNNLTIANNGGPYTIGQDNTHRLKEFEVKGAGNIVIDNTVFTKRFNMNSTGHR